MIKKGSWVVVEATTKYSEKSYPAAKWIGRWGKGRFSVAVLLEDAPHKGTLDVINVQTFYGEEDTIYDFNIVGKIVNPRMY